MAGPPDAHARASSPHRHDAAHLSWSSPPPSLVRVRAKVRVRKARQRTNKRVRWGSLVLNADGRAAGGLACGSLELCGGEAWLVLLLMMRMPALIVMMLLTCRGRDGRRRRYNQCRGKRGVHAATAQPKCVAVHVLHCGGQHPRGWCDHTGWYHRQLIRLSCASAIW